MSEFVQAAYNVHEHDYLQRTDEALQERLAQLHINIRNIGYTGLRLAQVRSEVNHISFELSERFRESKQQDVEMAWSENSLKENTPA